MVLTVDWLKLHSTKLKSSVRPEKESNSDSGPKAGHGDFNCDSTPLAFSLK